MTLREFMLRHDIGEGKGLAFARHKATSKALHTMLKIMEADCDKTLPTDVGDFELCTVTRSLPSLLEVLAKREEGGSLDYITARLAQTCRQRVKQQAKLYGFHRALT